MARSNCLAPLAIFMVLFVQSMSLGTDIYTGSWLDGHATFYGDMAGHGILDGACGYGQINNPGYYGLWTTALSVALYNNGLSCGACFEVKCVNSPLCYKTAPWIKVTAVDLCPGGNWCDPPLKHFDLSMKMFTTIAPISAGVVPIQFRRVPCVRAQGVNFLIKGSPNFLIVLVYNVANAGDVYAMSVKGSKTGWIPMSRNWGQNWNVGTNLGGQALSFRVTTSDRKTLDFINVAPPQWQFGQSYKSPTNF
ncbi:expansin-A23-like [Lotus japonicus]|uniref:expansin-A23-like n=1 Tax=Lotus japonicus TaxID=34305 RepID=UPI0025839F07|nr:expansin-A23-like [Lotus japonicus]